MSEAIENRAVLFSVPCTCGTCQTVYQWILLRWCACCGDAICSDCFPKDLHDGGLDRCRKCIETKRPTALELAGYRRAMEEWRPFYERLGLALPEPPAEYAPWLDPGPKAIVAEAR